MDNTNWKTYRIGEIFSISTGSLLDTKTLQHGKIPRISAKSEGNGILGYFDTENLGEARHVENSITVNFFGADGGVFFHEGKVSLEMKVHSLSIFGRRISKEEGLFLATAVKKSLHGFGYGNQLSSSKLRDGDFSINLPALTDGSPDYGFMADHVRRIQADHVRRIQAYLEATGLSDTVLTEEEEEALALKTNWREFKIEDLFEIKLSTGDNKSSELPKGKIPLISAGSSNNGITAYVTNGDGKAQLFEGNCITVDMFGKAYYQPEDFYAVSHGRVNILTPNNKIPKDALLFIVSTLNHFTKIYSYSLMLTSKRAKEEKVNLPALPDGAPDYAFMETYIRATQKRVIKNLVEWNAKELAAYQSVI